MKSLCCDNALNSVISFRDASRDCGEGIAVAAEGNCVADCVFKTVAFKERDDSFRYGFLTGFIEAVYWANFVKRPV